MLLYDRRFLLLKTDVFDHSILSKRYSWLTIDYGEYSKLTVDLFFDPWIKIVVRSIVECHPIAV